MRHLSKTHLSDGQLPEYKAAPAKEGAATEAAPLINADASLAGGRPVTPAQAPAGSYLADISSSGLIQ